MHVLGPRRGKRRGRGDEVVLPGQLRVLLGILLADRDVAVSTDVIVERLWPGEAPRTAVKGVQVLAGSVASCLEPGLADAGSSRRHRHDRRRLPARRR